MGPRARRWEIVLLSTAVIAYSLVVLGLVASMADIGLRCVFGVRVRAEIDPNLHPWSPERPGDPARPRVGDIVRSVAVPAETVRVADFTDFIRAERSMRAWLARGETVVRVGWSPADDPSRLHHALAPLRPRPLDSWLRSVVWFLMELVIFAIGAAVSWRRPTDRTARLFFRLCLVTVGAYIGGYHWSEIAISGPLIFAFAAFALFVPVVSLHFYLVFPAPLPAYARHHRLVRLALYGVPLAYLAALWGNMAWLAWIQDRGGPPVEAALARVAALALGYVAVAALVFGLCLLCLLARVRRTTDPRERHQVKWILWASILSVPPIVLLLSRAAADASALGRDDAAWPMFLVSFLYTVAYAMSITRYKLMRVDEIINRSVLYMAVSVGAGLLYAAVVVVGAVLVGDRLLARDPSRQGIFAAFTAVLLLVALGFARDRLQRALDRRFHKEKYKFDIAMRRMGQAVGRIIDRSTIAARLLDTAAETLRFDWGAVYQLRDPEHRENPDDPDTDPEAPPRPSSDTADDASYALLASLGPPPEHALLPHSHPMVARLVAEPARPLAPPRAFVDRDPAADAMIRLGGEAALALSDPDGRVVALMLLGPKRDGLPYEAEELAFLAALGSFAALALRAAGIQRTLAELNAELRDKVGKIAEQRQRILALERAVSRALDDRDRDQHQLPEATEKKTIPNPNPVPIPNRTPAPTKSPARRDPELPPDLPFRGESPATRRLLELAARVAPGDTAILVTGESGTGKELLAETIHALGPRRAGPLVKVHCAALPSTLLESELFGHVKGAFTGADRDRVGRFQQADGGTLFLDEIGDVAPDVQVKLLRVLQEKTFELVGSSRSVRVDVRIIAATHRDLPALIRQNRFREDLYYRLNVIELRVPPLRERGPDLLHLARHFLARHADRLAKPLEGFDDAALRLLAKHHWPGNVRELENVVQRAVVLADGPRITPRDLPETLRPRNPTPTAPPRDDDDRHESPATPTPTPTPTATADPDAPPRATEHQGPAWTPDDDAAERRREIQALREALRAARGNKSRAARILGIPRTTLIGKLRRHNLV